MLHGVGILLLAAVGGFWVYERGLSHKGELKRIGRILGAFIIIVSMIGVVCKVWYLTSGHGDMGKTGKGLYHHSRGLR